MQQDIATLHLGNDRSAGCKAAIKTTMSNLAKYSNPLFQCVKFLFRAAQGHKVLPVIRGLHCAVFDVHKGSIYTFLPELPYFL